MGFSTDSLYNNIGVRLNVMLNPDLSSGQVYFSILK